VVSVRCKNISLNRRLPTPDVSSLVPQSKFVAVMICILDAKDVLVS